MWKAIKHKYFTEILDLFKDKVFEKYQQISIILNYLPFKEGVALHLNKLAFPLPSDVLC